MSLEKEFDKYKNKVLQSDATDTDLYDIPELCYSVNLMIPTSILDSINVLAELHGLTIEEAIIETIYHNNRLIMVPVEGDVFLVDEAGNTAEHNGNFVASIAIVNEEELNTELEQNKL
jgi:hypothetical protein